MASRSLARGMDRSGFRPLKTQARGRSQNHVNFLIELPPNLYWREWQVEINRYHRNSHLSLFLHRSCCLHNSRCIVKSSFKSPGALRPLLTKGSIWAGFMYCEIYVHPWPSDRKVMIVTCVVRL
jgi:hypothetical protein